VGQRLLSCVDEAHLLQATPLAEARLAEAPDDDQARFALGAATIAVFSSQVPDGLNPNFLQGVLSTSRHRGFLRQIKAEVGANL
jgi:hypothetical protein